MRLTRCRGGSAIRWLVILGGALLGGVVAGMVVVGLRQEAPPTPAQPPQKVAQAVVPTPKAEEPVPMAGQEQTSEEKPVNEQQQEEPGSTAPAGEPLDMSPAAVQIRQLAEEYLKACRDMARLAAANWDAMSDTEKVQSIFSNYAMDKKKMEAAGLSVEKDAKQILEKETEIRNNLPTLWSNLKPEEAEAFRQLGTSIRNRAREVGEAGLPELTRLYQQLAHDSAEDQVSCWVLATLCRTKGGVDVLLRSTLSKDEEIRGKSISFLSMFKDDPRIVPRAIEMLKDPSQKVRGCSVTTLEILGDERGLAGLREIAESEPDDFLRAYAQQAALKLEAKFSKGPEREPDVQPIPPAPLLSVHAVATTTPPPQGDIKWLEVRLKGTDEVLWIDPLPIFTQRSVARALRVPVAEGPTTVLLQMTRDVALILGHYTSRHAKGRLAVLFNGEPIAAPEIWFQFTSHFGLDQAFSDKEIETILNAINYAPR